MARSRLEKIGTIYSRTKGLLQAGALQWEDRPLWYDLYEAFPPLEEPKYDRPAPNIRLRKIFYEEDKIRALLHNRNKHIGTINMFNNASQTLTKRFIQAYRTLEEKYEGEVSEEQLYEEAIQLVEHEKQKFAKSADDVSLVSSFKQAQNKQNSENVAIKFIDFVMAKFLTKTNILNEENTESVVIYFTYVTNYINSYLQTKKPANTARENYRIMKKWQQFVNNLNSKRN